MLCALLYRDRAAADMAGEPAQPPRLCSGSAPPCSRASSASCRCSTIIGFFDKVPLQSLLSIGSGLLLLGLVFKGGPGSLFRSQPALLLSRLAYCLYLVHLALLPMAQAFCANLDWYDGLSRGAQFLVFLPPYLLIATAGGVDPALRRGKALPAVARTPHVPPPRSAGTRPSGRRARK